MEEDLWGGDDEGSSNGGVSGGGGGGSQVSELSPTNVNEEKRECGSAILKQLLSQNEEDDEFERKRNASINQSIRDHKAKAIQLTSTCGIIYRLSCVREFRSSLQDSPSIRKCYGRFLVPMDLFFFLQSKLRWMIIMTQVIRFIHSFIHLFISQSKLKWMIMKQVIRFIHLFFCSQN